MTVHQALETLKARFQYVSGVADPHLEAFKFVIALDALGLLPADKAPEPAPVPPGLSEDELVGVIENRLTSIGVGPAMYHGYLNREGARALARSLLASGYRLIESKT